ncbi:unnamed protein product, partial [Discosporangium mesarthrocarpum]
VSEDEIPVWQNWHDESEPVRVGVSACLLGAEVRFDGGHKRDRYVTDILGAHVEWRPVCPELEAGLGLPRPAIQLVGGERGDRLVVRGDGEDVTEKMARYAEPRVAELLEAGLDGFVFKKDSPSCGVFRGRVRPTGDGMPVRTGIGHFSRVVVDACPDLPVEEEGRLNDARLREGFIEAIFCHNRWRVLVKRGLTRGSLVAFHEAHKMLLLAHDEARYRSLGRIVGSFGQVPDEDVYRDYETDFLAAIRRPASVGRHVNVLEHLFGHMKQALRPREKAEIGVAIQDYRAGRVPLVVPVTLLRFLVTSHEVDYVGGQLYLEPHPREMMLRNHV